MRTRSPERIIKLYDWLWRRARNKNKCPLYHIQPKTLTGHALLLLAPQVIPIRQAMKTPAYRKAVSKLIHSN